MERNDPRYQAYVEILKEELIPAMGCTEPIALAYAAAKAREVLGVLPDSVRRRPGRFWARCPIGWPSVPAAASSRT